VRPTPLWSRVPEKNREETLRASSRSPNTDDTSQAAAGALKGVAGDKGPRGFVSPDGTGVYVGDFYGLVRENAILFRRLPYNWLVQLQQWKDKDKVASEFNDPASIARAYQGLFGADFERNGEYADRIAAETLIVGGTADQYFDAAAFEETARRIPVARLELFEGETHMLPVERRRDVARVVAEFLKTEDAARFGV
jgi:pimeloyl-ACP methyl ester carboxylesterase